MSDFNHEEILLKELKESNEAIIGYLFHLYYSGLVIFAQKIISENEVAEDIVQNFFIKLWVNRKTIEIKQSIKSYFFNSVKNQCLDYIRHQKVKLKVDAYLIQEFIETTENDYLVESELRESINKALDKLPPVCREVFVENRFAGIKAKEIAEKKGISIRTVNGHINKALKIMRIELEPYFPLLLLLYPFL